MVASRARLLSVVEVALAAEAASFQVAFQVERLQVEAVLAFVVAPSCRSG